MVWPFRARRRSEAGTTTAQFDAYTPVDDLIRMMSSAEGPVTRAEALSVAAVARGRNLLCSIATLPMREYGPDGRIVDNPLLRQLDPDVPNIVTIAQTVEDLIFDGIAWWRITGFSWTGFPATVRRLDPRAVSVRPPAGRTSAPLPSGVDPRDAVVWVDGRPVPAGEMIRFDSPAPPICTVGARSIRRAILLDKAAKMYAENPAPAEYVTQPETAPRLDDEQIRSWIRQWIAARRQRSTGFVPRELQLNTVSSPSAADIQLVQLQQQASLEICNLMGVDPEDVGLNVTSRTYFNAQDRRLSRVNDVLAPYMLAFSQRLSMNDVTPRGHEVRFDLDDYMKADPATRWQTYEKAIALGVYGPEYVQVLEDVPPEFRRRPAQGLAEAPEEPAAADDTPEPQEAAVEASEPARQFAEDRPGAQFVDLPLQSFSVDRESRVIEGVALPYGKSAKGIRFERGALQYADVKRVKLDVDHDPKQTIGVATEIHDSPNGLRVKFKVSRTPEGDRALMLAEDGVYDGLSVDVDFDPVRDAVADPRAKTGLLVKRADLRRVALTSSPAFDDARVTRVAASADTKEELVTDTDTTEPTTAPEPAPAEVPAQFSADELSALRELLAERQKPAAPVREFVDPRRPVASAVVTREPVPYRFDRAGRFAPVEPGDNVFSADLYEMARKRDNYGTETEAGKRVMGLIRARFAADPTVVADVNELNPDINRPEMYVDLRPYRYPIWSAINKGAPPNGVQPFMFPKRSSSSIAVTTHTEGAEPEGQGIVSTKDTVTPVALSGKASITREVWDQRGNPAVSELIWRELERSWFEGLETASAAFLNTLSAATDIDLGDGTADEALAAAWDRELAKLNFVRGYDFSFFALEQDLYLAFVDATATDGRKIYPQITPTNANGQAEPRYTQLNLGGVIGRPAWALPSSQSHNSEANSWLFDPSCVWGWATEPQRLEFPGTDASGGYAPTAMIDIVLWGYRAFACTDIGGVRQVIYDPTPDSLDN